MKYLVIDVLAECDTEEEAESQADLYGFDEDSEVFIVEVDDDWDEDEYNLRQQYSGYLD